MFKNEEDKRQKIDIMGNAIDDILKRDDYYGRHMGFALIMFPFEPGSRADYVSNARREDMIKALREAADTLERGDDTIR